MRTSKEIYKSHEWWKKVSLSLGIFKRFILSDSILTLDEGAIRSAIDELRFVKSDLQGMRVRGEVLDMHGYLIDAISCLQMAFEEKLKSQDGQYSTFLQEARLHTRKLQSNLLYNGIIESFLPHSTFISKPGYFAHVTESNAGNAVAELPFNKGIGLFAVHMSFRVFVLLIFIVTCVMITKSIIPTGDLF